MQELSLLGKECLINIPMLLDVIAMTVEEMRGMFSPFYNNIKTFLVNELEANWKSHATLTPLAKQDCPPLATI